MYKILIADIILWLLKHDWRRDIYGNLLDVPQ